MMNHVNAGDWQAGSLCVKPVVRPRLGLLGRLGAVCDSLDDHPEIIRSVVLAGFLILVVTMVFFLP